ncbi:helix-turn-helix domain-containing protein [Salinimicrobium sp. 3283s]|uniref:helix-turn-helix transcriptional regulator n=1 Tax=Salinimicrobium sp. 3283s TaxID=3114359 RepID=UPI0031E5B99E
MTVEEKISTFSEEFEKLPGVTVINEIEGFKPLFMTSNGLELLGLTLNELIATKENYQHIYFKSNYIRDYLESLESLIELEGLDETYTFFHQVKIQGSFQWYAASIKIFHIEAHFQPTHTITYAVPLKDFEWTIRRAERLMEETDFARKNLEKYGKLTPREIETLGLAGKGMRTNEMAERLNISSDTVNSHLKSLRKKLEVANSFELQEYARAYDLM